MSAFIVNTKNLSVAGFVQNNDVANEKAGVDCIAISSSKELEGMSLQQLTDLYNIINVSSEASPISRFKIAKDKAAIKVYAALTAIDMSTLVQLDAEVEKKIEEVSIEIEKKEVAEVKFDANGKKLRKVRDSKMQRMKAMFLTRNEDGTYKQWTIKELMEGSNTSANTTKVYISTFRSATDRFVMSIEKQPHVDGMADRWMFNPEDQDSVEQLNIQA